MKWLAFPYSRDRCQVIWEGPQPLVEPNEILRFKKVDMPCLVPSLDIIRQSDAKRGPGSITVDQRRPKLRGWPWCMVPQSNPTVTLDHGRESVATGSQRRQGILSEAKAENTMHRDWKTTSGQFTTLLTLKSRLHRHERESR